MKYLTAICGHFVYTCFGLNGAKIKTDMEKLMIDQNLLINLFEQAKTSERLRQNYDLRTNADDGSQRMLNAMLPGTVVPIHHHPISSENVICLCGRFYEVLFDEDCNETARFLVCPSEGNFGWTVPAGVWHTVEVIEPTVIYEAKFGKFGQDGSETYDEFKAKLAQSTSTPGASALFNSLGDLKKNIEYLIGMECKSGSMDRLTSLSISRMLNVPLEEVEKAMKEINL